MLGPHLRVVVGKDGEVYREILRICVAWEELDWVTWAVRKDQGLVSQWRWEGDEVPDEGRIRRGLGGGGVEPGEETEWHRGLIVSFSGREQGEPGLEREGYLYARGPAGLGHP